MAFSVTRFNIINRGQINGRAIVYPTTSRSFDDFENYTNGISLTSFSTGSGWAGTGAVVPLTSPTASDSFESYPTGTITSSLSSGSGWDDSGFAGTPIFAYQSASAFYSMRVNGTDDATPGEFSQPYDGYKNIPWSPLYNFTFEFWVKRNGWTTGSRATLFDWANRSAFGVWAETGSSKIHFAPHGLVDYAVSSSTTLANTTWTHVAVRVSQSLIPPTFIPSYPGQLTVKYDICINGAVEGSNVYVQTAPGDPFFDPYLMFDCSTSVGAGFAQTHGTGNPGTPLGSYRSPITITEVRFWSGSRSNEQISTWYNKRLTASETGSLLTYWNFGNTTINKSTDAFGVMDAVYGASRTPMYLSAKSVLVTNDYPSAITG
jgi:hypothetical protein